MSKFVRISVLYQPVLIEFVLHRHTGYFNTTLFGKQSRVCEKTFYEWKYDTNTMLKFVQISKLLSISQSNLFAMQFKNQKYDGMYIHPFLVPNYLQYVTPKYAPKITAVFLECTSRSFIV